MSIAQDASPPLAARVALLSIAGFWGFYFTILTLRSIVIYHNQIALLGARAVVSIVGGAVTVGVYLLMRRVPAARLRRSIVTAMLLAIPAATLYSATNWYVMKLAEGDESRRWSVTVPAIRIPAVPPPPIVRPDADDTDNADDGDGDPPVPPPPAAEMTVGKVTVSDDKMTPLQSIADQAANGYFFFIAWAALYLALCYAAEVGTLERRAAALAAAAQSAELRALRYQVNPHFLFNTLNSLSSLVLSGRRDEAERMIINLSTFFRTSLTGDPTEDVPLSEEIRLQRLYLAIEAVRFPERLVVEIDVPDALATACIPGLILQPLVENAVKYGVSRVTRPVTIRIVAREAANGLHLVVKDDGDALPAPAGGAGVGLQNVRDRLRARFGDAALLRCGPGAEGGFAVHFLLPLTHHGC